MVPININHKKYCSFLPNNSLLARDEVCHLCQSIYDYKYHIKVLWRWQIGNEVHGNKRPRLSWNRPYGRCWGFFNLVQVSQDNNKFFDDLLHLGPPKILRNEFQRFVEPKISSSWKIMTSLQDPEACGSFWNIQVLFKVKKVIHNPESLTIVVRVTLDIKNWRVHGWCYTNLIKKWRVYQNWHGCWTKA
jgi:hypothetical protein